ncbi:MAG: hypothetical protein EKK53_19480 [Burkholderiales bacterium]|nr:MAG: hypothetical protein EKK53_19480 [Burkholderiales bacterium]
MLLLSILERRNDERSDTRARIDGADWIVVVNDRTIALRRPSLDCDPRVAYSEMKFDADQEVLLEHGCVSATRSDEKGAGQVKMWLFREQQIANEDVLQGRSEGSAWRASCLRRP